MKETEPYTKVHDFLFTDLKLSEMMAYSYGHQPACGMAGWRSLIGS